MSSQRFPRTVVVLNRSGIGDLVWHLPYFEAMARHSAHGRVTVIARPSCHAADLLAGTPWVEQVIEFDYKLRGTATRGTKHRSIFAQLRFVASLRRERFDRVFIFAGRFYFPALMMLAGIPERAGFGFGFAGRMFLNRPPYIKRYCGPGSWVYPEATEFAKAHGFVSSPVRPHLEISDASLETADTMLGAIPENRIAFAIGSSESRKQWGATRFSELTRLLCEHGRSVVLIGGPAEREMGDEILAALPPQLRERVLLVAQPSVLVSAALVSRCALCVGNDTGMLNVAAACDVPTIGLFGATQALQHDPLIEGVSASSMREIAVEDVFRAITGHHAWLKQEISSK